MNFEYSSEWYGSRITSDWMHMGGDRATPRGLKKWYNSSNNMRYHGRFKQWFAGQSLTGRGLELGFQCGKSTYWLSQLFPEVILDILDWNEKLAALEGPIRELSNVNEMMLCDCRKTGKPDGHYDFITSLDFYEHLPEDVYFESIIECHRLLRSDGLFFVFLGKGAHPAHINVRPVQQQVDDISSRGFDLASQEVVGNDTMNVFQRVEK